MAHWTDDGKQRFEFEWHVGDNDGGETCMRPMTRNDGTPCVWAVMTRESLTAFIERAQKLLDDNPAQ